MHVTCIHQRTAQLSKETDQSEKDKVTDPERNYYLIHYWWKYEQNYEKISILSEIKNGEFGVLLKWFLEGL